MKVFPPASGGGAPSGSAGGDLGGTYPNPTVSAARGLRETAGPTVLTVGAILDGEAPVRSGSTFVGKFNKTVAQSADVTEASDTNPVDITGLSVVLPRAGTYHVTAVLPWTAGDATSRTMGIGLAFSGSTTLISGAVPSGTTGAIVSGGLSQTTMGTLGTLASVTGTAGRIMPVYVVKVSTSGTLKMQFSRSAASITHTTGIMTVREA